MSQTRSQWRARATSRTKSSLRRASSSVYVLRSPYAVQTPAGGFHSRRCTSLRILRTFATNSSFLNTLHLVLHLLRLAGVALLELRVQDHVREDAPADAVAEVHQRADLGRPDAVDRAAQPRLERHALGSFERIREGEPTSTKVGRAPLNWTLY